ncbi:MAG TPA: carboxypeptidase-like regulatory domain-containing protein [Gemmatimonadota bacterium]|nr:carboxypeptidase-like regulatory domain-containing protein [Gemmatimonadota bacterium]
MPRPVYRSLAAVLVPLALAACGGSSEAPSGVPRALDPAARWTCTGEVADLVDEIFPPPGLRNMALSRCANIQRQYARGEILDATAMVYELIEDAIDDAANGLLLTPPSRTLEEALADLIAALLAEVGLEPGAGEVVVGVVDETGGDVTVPSGHAALSFDPDDVSGETWVTIIGLADPLVAGACPFGFPVPYDCYPLFFDMSLEPASNLQDAVTAGLCVADTGPLAPPNATVAGRLQLASPDPNNPGQIVFWPVVAAPSGVDCSDLAFAPTGWQKDLFALLGPAARLFEVAPAWADPGSLGGSMTSFSPVAATDPDTTGSTTPALLAPASGATIAQNDPATADEDCTFSNGTWGFLIPFDWTDVAGAASYDLEMMLQSAAVPAIEVNVADSDYLHVECTGFVVDVNLTGWTWKVRAVDANNVAGPWSEDRPIQFSSVNVSTSGTISGRVTDENGNGIPGATVVIQSTAYAATTNVDGDYVIAGIVIPCCTLNANGGTVTHTVQASSVGFTSDTTTVTITTGVPAAEADIQLGSP